MSVTHIETIELGSSQSSITFSSIPQDYDDLIIKVSARVDAGTSIEAIELTLNSDTGSNYDYIRLEGTGSGTDPNSGSSNFIGRVPTSSVTSNTFGNMDIYISNYTSSTDKSVSVDSVTENNATAARQDLVAYKYTTSSAITAAELSSTQGDFVSGCTASLYGVTAGGDGTVTTS